MVNLVVFLVIDMSAVEILHILLRVMCHEPSGIIKLHCMLKTNDRPTHNKAMSEIQINHDQSRPQRNGNNQFHAITI